MAEISAERQKLSDVLAERFPDYVALANPKPLTLKETQDLLCRRRGGRGLQYRGEEELCVGGDAGRRADWTEIPITAKSLNDEVQNLRQSLTFETDEPFDAALSYAVYQQTFGPIARQDCWQDAPLHRCQRGAHLDPLRHPHHVRSARQEAQGRWTG